jgi:hypothetical protein
MGGGDDNVGIAVPNNNETISGDGNDNILDENRNNEGSNDIGNDANLVDKCSDGYNVVGDICDGIVNSNGGNDSNYVGNLPVSGEAVGERKKKVKTGQQFKGGGDDNVGLDVSNHNVTYSGDGNGNVLDENRNNEGGKDVFNDADNVGKSCDDDNGDGENSDGIVNSNGGNDSNDVIYPPDSGDAVGERKKKVRKGLQSKGGGDNNVGVDGPNHDDTNSSDGNDNVLDDNSNNDGGKVVCDDVSCCFQCSLRCFCHLLIFKEILSLCCWLRHPVCEVSHGSSRHYLEELFHPNSVAHISIQSSDLR